MSEVFVIGHKNPDTDSICSAIGYAYFLREARQMDARAARCGEINPRIQFVLDEAGLKAPTLLMDVRPTAGRICRREVISATPDEPFYTVYRRMQTHKVRGIPVRDEAGRILGILPLLNLLELLLPHSNESVHEPRRVDTSLERVVKVLNGSFEHVVESGRDETLMLVVGAMSAASFSQRISKYPPEQTLLVTGDRPTIQEQGINYGVRCLVLTGGHRLSPDLLEKAMAKGVSVLSSPVDTATTTLLIRSASTLGPAISTSFISFKASTPVRTIRRQIEGLAQELFPVVDEEDNFIGVFTKSELVNPRRTSLIMVDHNEMGQAVNGVEEAEILAVIDHHRLGGGLTTREPIRFVNEPVGSTCTMVTRFFRDAGLQPPRSIAICLAAGIISDTLNLTSPTATPTDQSQLDWLATTCDLDTQDLAVRFFSAGSILQQLTPAAALESDCKTYTENDWSFAVSQIEEVGTAGFQQAQAALQTALENLVKKRQLDFACLMLTDITEHTSLLLCAGDEMVLEAIDYPLVEHNLFTMEGVVSRKKQLLPHLSRIVVNLKK